MNRREKMEIELDKAIEAGDWQMEYLIYAELANICECGGDAEGQYDGYGIYCGKMCNACFKKQYRSDIKERYFDPTYAGESLEEPE